MQIELPEGELEPAEQFWHVDDNEAPTAAEYVPAAHAMHGAAPADSLYLPATHATQAPTLLKIVPVYAALHMQLVRMELPAGEVEFGGQSMHRDDPFKIL